MKKVIILLSLIFVLNSCNEGEKQKENIGINSGSITNTGNVEVSKKDENLAIENSGSIINSGSLEEEKVSSGSVESEEKTNSGSFKEIEFYGIDFNLSYNDGKFELTGDMTLGETGNFVEILSCKENISKMYDENWYKLEKEFKYNISKKLNNYCEIPYKVRLNGDDAKVVELDLYLSFIDGTAYNIKNSLDKKINLNTFTKLDKYIGIDKNNLFYYYYIIMECNYKTFNVKNYKSYKLYENGLIIGDNLVYNINGEKGIGIDLNTFEQIKYGYFKDKNNYYQISYYIGEKIKNYFQFEV